MNADIETNKIWLYVFYVFFLNFFLQFSQWKLDHSDRETSLRQSAQSTNHVRICYLFENVVKKSIKQ